jgi:mannose PTS system EIIA component
MVTIAILAHAPLASALRAATAHLGLDCSHVLALDVPADADADSALAQGHALLQALPPQAELLLLSDAFQATPCNTARALAAGRNARVLCGVNLPMLWSLLGRHAQRPLDELVQRALGTGKDGVMHVPALLPPAQRPRTENHAQDHGHHQQ